MYHETVNRIEVLDTGELLLGLEGQGKPMYQYIYRAAAGVYWDQAQRGFKCTPLKEWSCSQWFNKIVSVVRSELGVELTLANHVTWSNVPEKEKAEILREGAI